MFSGLLKHLPENWVATFAWVVSKHRANAVVHLSPVTPWNTRVALAAPCNTNWYAACMNPYIPRF
jgi:hypothetical protein